MNIKWTRDADNNRYARHNGKWCKVSKNRNGSYTLAKGWKGSYNAHDVTYGHRLMRDAKIAAENWLKD